MQHDYKQVLRYGFCLLTIVTGFLLVIFVSTSFQSFKTMFEIFQQEKSLVGNHHYYSFSLGTYQGVIIVLALFFLSALFLWYCFRPSQTNISQALRLNLKSLWFLYKKLHQQWKSLPVWEKAIFMAIIILLICIR